MNKLRGKENAMNMKRMHAIPVALLGLTLTLGLLSSAQAQDTPKDWPSPMHDDTVLSKFMLERFERRDAKPADLTYWEAQAWIGGDINKLWFKTEGSRTQGTTEDANLELYYSRAVAAFWDVQVGVRHDLSAGSTPARDWLGVGFQGLAPYLFEVDATAYLGGNGRSALRLKAGYDLLLSQRLVLMPELELSAYGKADPERSLGSGLSDASMTLSLRYEIRREFAPYVGVMWTQKYGGTADYARSAGDAASETQYLVGIRAWW